MKRKLLIKHLQLHGCVLAREGKKHSLYVNTKNNQTSAVPRHADIKDLLAKEICSELGIPKVGSN